MLQSSRNYTRMFFLMISWSSWKMGYVCSKSRSLGQICSKPCAHTRGHSFASSIINFYQNVSLGDMLVSFNWPYWLKNLATRSNFLFLNLVLPLEATLLLKSSPSRGLNFASILIIFTRMFLLMISQSSLNMGHVGSKTRSLCRISLKPCSPSQGHNFSSIFLEFYQNV